jgi:hypothetical protein
MNRSIVTKLALALALALTACMTDPDDPSLEQTSEDIVTLDTITQIRNVMSGKCMDIRGGATASGAVVQQYGCFHYPDQQYTFVQGSSGLLHIYIPFSNKCVSATGYQGWNTVRMPLVQLACDWNNPYESFTIDRAVNITGGSRAALRWAYDSAYCIDVPYGSPTDSLALQLYACHGGNNQTFDLTQ